MNLNVINLQNLDCTCAIKQWLCCFPKSIENKLELTSNPDTMIEYPLDIKAIQFFIVDKNINYLHSSGIRELNIESKNMIGKNINDILDEDIAAFFKSLYEEAFKALTMVRTQLMINNVQTEIFVVPIMSANNEIYGGVLARVPYKKVLKPKLSKIPFKLLSK
jgi:hypothetical protein